MEFCRRLTERGRTEGWLPPGYTVTLPSEAQWEYACRAGTTDDFGGRMEFVGWYSGNSEDHTHVAGRKKPNAWGLDDMHGNVWEWCLDWYGTYPGGSVTDPTGATSGTRRVIRGGSWSSVSARCRASVRDGWKPGERGNDVGFRLALNPVVSP
jgi:formylglycine-generating enzyme required for sulfatase activity